MELYLHLISVYLIMTYDFIVDGGCYYCSCVLKCVAQWWKLNTQRWHVTPYPHPLSPLLSLSVCVCARTCGGGSAAAVNCDLSFQYCSVLQIISRASLVPSLSAASMRSEGIIFHSRLRQVHLCNFHWCVIILYFVFLFSHR